MGWMSIFHRFHTNLVVILLCSDPLDENDLVTIVDAHHQPVRPDRKSTRD
jgi:hypothetical protein